MDTIGWLREPPDVLLVPRPRTIGLLKFNRAEACIADGRACVEQALPTIRRYFEPRS